MKETMSVAKALKELKLLKKRISSSIRGDEDWMASRALNKPLFVTKQQADKPVYGKVTAAMFMKNAKEKYQSIKYLIDRYKKIKKAVIQSNATTMVTIGDKTMTVAQAIEYKGSVEYETALLNKIVQEYKSAVEDVADNNERVMEQADSHIINIYGSEGKERSKNTLDEMQKTRDWYMREHEWKVVDSIDAEEVIEEYSNKIDTFMSGVDDVINTSNVRTDITIE